MSAIASRYARAFADVVFAHNLDANQAQQQLADLAELVRDSQELRRVLENPAVPHPQKIKLLDAVVGRLGGSQQVRNCAAILVDKRRIGLLPEIAEQLKAEINERLGFAEAEVATSRDLSADERSALEQQVSKLTGKKVRARYQRDPQLLGGVVVKVGSTIYDGSVRGQLQRLRTAMAE